MFPAAVDAAIVGGGPAGTAAALALLRYTGMSIVLVERSRYAERRVGETVSPGLLPLLAYLGVEDLLTGAGHGRSVGRLAAWGQPQPVPRDALFDPAGAGWHLDRRRFDAGLANAVEQRGGIVLHGTTASSATRDGVGWTLTTKGSAAGRIAATHLIVATGMGTALHAALGSSRTVGDRLVGLVTWVDQEPPAELLIEAAPDGWWYSAPVPGGLVGAYMSDADLVHPADVDARGFDRLLETAPLTAARIRGTRRSPPRAFPAASQQASRCLGEGWVAAGDAVAAFDPLSSLGIGHAVATGIQAARIVAERAGGRSTMASAYAADVAANVAAYRVRHRQLYGLERRWEDRPFWSRRHAPVGSTTSARVRNER